MLGMALGKTNTLLPHYPRQAKHFSELRLVSLWDAYFKAKRLRIETLKRDRIF